MRFPPLRILPLAIAVALTVAVATPARPSRAEGAADCADGTCRARFTGTWRYAGGAAEKRQRIAAIDRATDDMFFVARAIARNRLEDDTVPYREIRIRVADGKVTIRTDVTWTTPADGAPRTLEDHKGDAYRVSTRFDGPLLVQRIRDDALDNRTTFRLRDGGRKMRMHLHIDHNRLSGVVDYHLTYRRQH